MEDRLEPAGDPPGVAVIALAVILALTAAWWALALWPAGAIEPRWLIRTRVACFGSGPDGLPDAGGWILLIGEPLGMLGLLAALMGRSLRRDFRWIRGRPAAALGAIAFAGLALVGFVTLGVRVTQGIIARRSTTIDLVAAPIRVDRRAPSIALVDQRGTRASLADLRGHAALLTFAYGHCATVCPSVVNDLRSARRLAKRPDVPLVIVTLDPWRDTPDRLPTLAAHWGLEPIDRVLSGSVADVEATLDALGINRRRNEVNGDIDHTTAAMVLDERGRIVWRLVGGQSSIVAILRTLRVRPAPDSLQQRELVTSSRD